MDIRQKLRGKHRGFGTSPPSWTRSDLARANRDPRGLLGGLGVGSFQGSGDDGLQDIFLLLSKAVNSSVLYGLYSSPTKREKRGEIELAAASDLYSFGSGAVMLRFIKAILAAGDSMGIIALPTGLKVEPNASRNGVLISWSGFVKT